MRGTRTKIFRTGLHLTMENVPLHANNSKNSQTISIDFWAESKSDSFYAVLDAGVKQTLFIAIGW